MFLAVGDGSTRSEHRYYSLKWMLFALVPTRGSGVAFQALLLRGLIVQAAIALASPGQALFIYLVIHNFE